MYHRLFGANGGFDHFKRRFKFCLREGGKCVYDRLWAVSFKAYGEIKAIN